MRERAGVISGAGRMQRDHSRRALAVRAYVVGSQCVPIRDGAVVPFGRRRLVDRWICLELVVSVPLGVHSVRHLCTRSRYVCVYRPCPHARPERACRRARSGYQMINDKPKTGITGRSATLEKNAPSAPTDNDVPSATIDHGSVTTAPSFRTPSIGSWRPA